MNNSIFNKLTSQLFYDKKIYDMKASLNKLQQDFHTVIHQDLTDDQKIIDVLTSKKVVESSMFVNDNNYEKNDTVFHDIEFFDKLSDKTKSIFSNIHNCSTEGGKTVAKYIYSNPISDIDILKSRNKCLHNIESIYMKNKQTTDELFDVLRTNEKSVIWLLEEKEETIKDLYSMVFFRLKGLQPLNKIGTALTSYNIYRILISPMFGILAPIIYFLIPYVIVLYRFKVPIPFTTYIKTLYYSVFTSGDTLFGQNKFFKYARIVSYVFSAVFYFQGIFTSVDVSKTVNKMCKMIINNFNSVIDYVNASNKLINIYWKANNYKAYVDIENVEDQQLEQFVSELIKIRREYSIFCNFGDQLKSYRTINFTLLTNMIKKTYILDSLIGAIKYKTERQFSISDYKEEGKPIIHFEGMVHPCIDKDKAVDNNVILGVTTSEQNAIITSPNSSGKSIFIKSIILNVLMSQTMGICCAKVSKLSPFKYITTQINVPDATGHESLFEAEMYRCKNTLDRLQDIHSNVEETNYSLVVMDEIFNSTNPVEAVAGAYAVCKKITSFSTNILIFTTHLNYLTKLAKENECRFVNYRMETHYNKGIDSINFTYKIEKGVNKHLLALELLKRSGFEDAIIDEAIEIKNKLLVKKK